MLNWLRLIPHPSYGNYGGAYNKCKKLICPLPIDWMDRAFCTHDEDLKKAETHAQRKAADNKLAKKLKKGNTKKLKLYGKLYRYCAMIIF